MQHSGSKECQPHGSSDCPEFMQSSPCGDCFCPNVQCKYECSKVRYTYRSATVHDHEHGGLNNDFLIKSRHPLAITYNDQSPLENHHVASATRLILQPEYQYITVCVWLVAHECVGKYACDCQPVAYTAVACTLYIQRASMAVLHKKRLSVVTVVWMLALYYRGQGLWTQFAAQLLQHDAECLADCLLYADCRS